MPDPELVAHRGFAALYPENTVGAFRGAVADGADAVELDVRACATSSPVVCHDATVDRTTDGTGPVASLTPEELAALSVRGSDDGVPTLDAALAAMPPETGVYAELKEGTVATAAADRLLEAPNPVVVSSFDPDALSVPRERGLATALLAAGDGLDTVAAAAELGCAAVHLHATACTERVVEYAREVGLAVAVWTLAPPGTGADDEWTVTDSEEHRRLRTLGVDAFVADAPV